MSNVTVVLDNVAINRLLFGAGGPVMNDLLKRGARVETQARARASRAANTSPGPYIGVKTHRLLDLMRTSPVFRGDASYVEVGTSATNEGFAYPAFHDVAGQGLHRGGERPWLTSALRDVFPS